MVASSQDVSDTLNVALACAAAFQVVHMQNEREPGSIESIALPGLGANTGKVPVDICADLMWTGYDLFRRKAFADFAEMRQALLTKLGDLDDMTGNQTKKSSGTTSPKSSSSSSSNTSPPPKAPPPKPVDQDFDDAEG
jgi:hypothetical protein